MLSQIPSQVCYAYLDVETTGLDPASGHKICEIAVVKSIDGQVADELVTLLNPGKAIPATAVSVHGITDAMVSRAPFFRQIAENLVEFLKDSVIVAHNAQFDLGFLNNELGYQDLSLPENKVIDTLGIARRYYTFPSNSLGNIAEYLGIPIENAHRALGDVMTTKSVFEYFLRDLDRRGIRLKRLKDILKLQGGAMEVKASREMVLPSEVEEALRLKGKLQIKYLSAYKDEATTRVIEPYDISVSSRNTYIHAYCHLRKDKCTFRLDRILDIKSLA